MVAATTHSPAERLLRHAPLSLFTYAGNYHPLPSRKAIETTVFVLGWLLVSLPPTPQPKGY